MQKVVEIKKVLYYQSALFAYYNYDVNPLKILHVDRCECYWYCVVCGFPFNYTIGKLEILWPSSMFRGTVELVNTFQNHTCFW